MMSKSLSKSVIVVVGLLVSAGLGFADQGLKTKDVVTPMDIRLEKTDGGQMTLAEVAKGKKAVLIDFWATWCGPCRKLMPALVEKAEILIPQNVEVIGINQDSKVKAEAVRNAYAIEFNWLMETKDNFYSKFFGINGIPSMVLLDSEGKLLWKGHPQSPGLEEALKKLDVSLKPVKA